MSLVELDIKKSIKIMWLSEGIIKEEQFDVLVFKSGQVEDFIEVLVKKVKIFSEEEVGKICVYEISSYYKWFRDLVRDYLVFSINDYMLVIVEWMFVEDVVVLD